jgi:hypothetical protein
MEMIQQILQRSTNFEKLRKVFFAFIVFLTIFQQFPSVYHSFYSEFRIVIYFLFGIFAITSIFSIRIWLSHISLRLFIFAIVSAIILTLINFYIKTSISFELITEFLVPFGIIVCALSLNLSEKELNIFMFTYILFSLLMGLVTIYYYGDGFVLSRDVYVVDNKNQIGPLLGISALIILLSIFDKNILNIKFLGIVPKIIIFALLMGCILVMRNRSGSLAIILALLLYLIISKKIIFNKDYLIMTILISSSFIILYFLGPLRSIVDFVWESFTRNYDISDLDDFSAGRFIVLFDATVYIRENPLLGSIGGVPFLGGSIHNYLLRKWAYYGLILSLPITLLYIYLYFFVIKNIFKKNDSVALLVGWLMFFSLIISNLEYSYPFGPGVSQLMLWFLFGFHIKKSKQNHIKIFY